MRILRLHLLRYGHFTNLPVDFPANQPDIHFIIGPNEAGKSTAMSAIEDLLFGIPGNSPRNFLHDYGAMRVGAVLEKDGCPLSIRRRKGNRDTLLTEEEVPLPTGEGALAPFLAGADRRFYTRMFSLDHERLRQGGREILEARDDVGQMLFAAGAGIMGLRERLKAMNSEADALWASRRAAHRKYFQAEDKLKAAEGSLRDHLITASKWQELKSAYEAATETCQTIEQQIEGRSSELRKLSRIRRVYRDVRKRSELDTAIQGIGQITLLSEDASSVLEKAARDDANAAARIATLTEQIDPLQKERAALTHDDALLLRAEDIQLLHERRIQIRAGKTDLPKRRAELAIAQTNLKHLATELEWKADDTDQLVARIPARAKAASVRTLLNQRGEQLAAVENAEAALEEVEEALCGLAAQIEEVGVPIDVSMLTTVIRATRDMGDFDARITSAERDVQDALAALQRRLKSLKPAVADEESLAAMSVPPLESIQAHRDQRRTLEQRLQACRERIRAADQDLTRHRKAYERITSDEHVVSPEELLRLRQHRDTGWSIIRRRYVDGSAVPDDEAGAFDPHGNIPDAYESAVKDADHAADGRFAKAEAAASLMVTARQIDEQQDLLESLRSEERAFVAEAAALAAAWKSMWTATPITLQEPDIMLEWVSARLEALDLAQRRDVAERQALAFRRQETGAKSRVFTELGMLGVKSESLAEQPLRIVIESAADVQRRHERNADSLRDLEEAQRKATSDAARKRKALQKTEREWSDWTTQWTAALTALGLSATATPETAQAQINAIDEMREMAGRINDLRHERIEKIERDIAAFESDVTGLAQVVAPQLADIESEDAVLELERLLADGVRIRELAAAKDSALAALREKVDECEESRRDAAEIIRHFQDTAGVDTLDALRAAIEQSDRLRALKSEHDQLTEALTEDGEGLSIAELTNECAVIDLDQVTAREQVVTQELQELRDRHMEARETRSNARREFEAIGGDDRAARDAADRQAALAEIKNIAEQYVRLRSAALLLQWAIDRYRREKQAPLLKRASQLFAVLTRGSFETLQLEFDEHDAAHLAGIRQNGTTVPVSGMSTGAADQLYLALRIAAVEDYLDRAAPLPFVADDLFINFDDDRAAAGFQVLGELAKKTQVLFFTHHRHLLNVATKALGASISIVLLPAIPPSGSELSRSAPHSAVRA